MPIFYKIIYVAKKASQQSIIFYSECRLLYPWLKMGLPWSKENLFGHPTLHKIMIFTG